MDAAFEDGLCLIYIQPVLRDSGWTQTGFAFGVSRDFYSLDPKAVAAQAVERALEKRGAKACAQRRVPPSSFRRGRHTICSGRFPLCSTQSARRRGLPGCRAKRAK